MTLEQQSKEYAEKRVNELDPSPYPTHRKMTQHIFNGCDIQEAYEVGYNAAIRKTVQWMMDYFLYYIKYIRDYKNFIKKE